MTEEEALDRVDTIGSMFENDLNDGDGPDWEGVHSHYNQAGETLLTYNGRYGDGASFSFTWRLELLEQTEKGPDHDDDIGTGG